MVARQWSATKLFSLMMVIGGLVTIAVPAAAHYGGWQAVCAARVFAGFAQGTVLPTLHTLLSRWVPTDERGRFGECSHFSFLHLYKYPAMRSRRCACIISNTRQKFLIMLKASSVFEVLSASKVSRRTLNVWKAAEVSYFGIFAYMVL